MSFSTRNPDLLRFIRINQGDAGIRETVINMRQQMNIAKRDPRILALVRQLTQGLKTDTEKSQALTEWFVNNIRYANDDAMSMTERGPQFIDIHSCPLSYQQCEPMELLYRPESLLFWTRQGDCDDFVMALGTMHELAGIKIKIITVAADSSTPQEFTHVYFQAFLDGHWIPIDPVNRSAPWGWELERTSKREVMA